MPIPKYLTINKRHFLGEYFFVGDSKKNVEPVKPPGRIVVLLNYFFRSSNGERLPYKVSINCG